MKRLLIFFAIIANILVITSCNKEKEEKEENPLVGTKWYMSENFAASMYSALNEGDWDYVIEFTSDKTFDSYYFNFATGNAGKERYRDNKYEYCVDSIRMIKDDGSYGTTYYFRSKTWMCTLKEGNNSDALSLYKIGE